MNPETLAKILKSARAWTLATAGGIGVAEHYLKTVEQAAGSPAHFAKFLKHTGTAHWANALKASASTLVYRNQHMGATGGIKCGRCGQADQTVEQFGEVGSFTTSALTKGSVMDFDCVITTKSQDRDGDILESAGAEPDLKMPLLWQHIPVEPIGKLLRITGKSPDMVSGACGIADTELGRDAAFLLGYGALRVSHGFRPLDAEPLDDRGVESTNATVNGWRIKRFEIMEVSLVSIPSNTDAVITGFSNGKFHHPLVKLWAGKMFTDRPTIVTHPGYAGSPNMPITVNVHLGDALKSLTGKFGRKDDGDGDEGNDPALAPDVASTDPAPDPATEQQPDPILLGDMQDTLTAVSGDATLTAEGKSRVQLCISMLATIQTEMDTYSSDMSDAADQQDLAGVFNSVQDMITDVVAKLSDVGDEIDRLLAIPDLSDATASRLSDLVSDIQSLKDSLGTISDSADEASADSDPNDPNSGIDSTQPDPGPAADGAAPDSGGDPNAADSSFSPGAAGTVPHGKKSIELTLKGSYFATCDRDEQGHCKAGSGSHPLTGEQHSGAGENGLPENTATANDGSAIVPHPHLPADHPWNTDESAIPVYSQDHQRHFDEEGKKLTLGQMDAESSHLGYEPDELPSQGGREKEEHDDLLSQHADWAAKNGAKPDDPGFSSSGVSRFAQSLKDSGKWDSAGKSVKKKLIAHKDVVATPEHTTPLDPVSERIPGQYNPSPSLDCMSPEHPVNDIFSPHYDSRMLGVDPSHPEHPFNDPKSPYFRSPAATVPILSA